MYFVKLCSANFFSQELSQQFLFYWFNFHIDRY